MVDIRRILAKFNNIKLIPSPTERARERVQSFPTDSALPSLGESDLRAEGESVSDTRLVRAGQDRGRGEGATKPLLKAGFSLAEVLIAMLIMSIFYVATTKVMTTRQKPQVQENPHGYYECYQNGVLMEHRVDMSRTTIQERAVPNCSFNSPKGLPFFNIYIVIPGSGFYSITEAQINDGDNMTFTSPAGLVTLYEELYPDIRTEMLKDTDEKYAQFKGYLDNAHPQAILTQAWGESVSPPYPAVLIVW